MRKGPLCLIPSTLQRGSRALEMFRAQEKIEVFRVARDPGVNAKGVSSPDQEGNTRIVQQLHRLPVKLIAGLFFFSCVECRFRHYDNNGSEALSACTPSLKNRSCRSEAADCSRQSVYLRPCPRGGNCESRLLRICTTANIRGVRFTTRLW